MNAERSRLFQETNHERRNYRREHPTEIAATMCMDGRVNLTVVCELPVGIISPFRNIGGRYDLGWPLLRHSLNELEGYAYKKRRPMLLIITYHWSKGDEHRGCAGFKYNMAEAIASMKKFKAQVDRCYGSRIQTILMGLETDSDCLAVHGDNGHIVDMCEKEGGSIPDIQGDLATLFPLMPEQMRTDVASLLFGNVQHIAKVRKEGRRLKEFKHNERVLAIGQGFDWLRNENLALIIGPCDPVLDQPIVTAATIIHRNWKEKRIPQGGVLLVSTPFRKWEDRHGAVEQSRYLVNLATRCIAEQVPEMADFFEPLVGVLDLETRGFEAIEF
ncbi:MAG: hypothetical protein AAB797_01920 [Patescibacteria group bacterium]